MSTQQPSPADSAAAGPVTPIPLSAPREFMTADELLRMPRGSMRYELIHGKLVTMTPAGAKHCGITSLLSAYLVTFVSQRRIGRVFTGDPGFILARNPDTVRAPDIAFLTNEQLGRLGIPDSFFVGAPDLAVEVVSPSQSMKEAASKAMEWLKHGTQIVWIVDPPSESVTAYEQDGAVRSFNKDDDLVAPKLLPGFSCRVGDIFANLPPESDAASSHTSPTLPQS